MQPITVQEMFDYCLEGEHVFLAHVVFWSVQNNLVRLTDDSNRLKEINVDLAAVKASAEQNILGMNVIKLYVIKDTKEYYAFYFAKNSLEASNLHSRMCSVLDNLIHLPIYTLKCVFFRASMS